MKACRRAGIKLVGGLLIIGGFIGVRIVSVDPSGIDSEIEKLEAVHEELAADAVERGAPAPEAPAEGGLVSKVSENVRSVLPSSRPAGPDAERLVSCRLGANVQFMRAADCLTRGGTSKDFDPKR